MGPVFLYFFQKFPNFSFSHGCRKGEAVGELFKIAAKKHSLFWVGKIFTTFGNTHKYFWKISYWLLPWKNSSDVHGVKVMFKASCFMFTMFLPSLLYSRRAILACYRWRSNKVSIMKIHWRFYSHCLIPLLWETTDMQELVRYFAEVSSFTWYVFLVFPKRKLDTVAYTLPNRLQQLWMWKNLKHHKFLVLGITCLGKHVLNCKDKNFILTMI